MLKIYTNLREFPILYKNNMYETCLKYNGTQTVQFSKKKNETFSLFFFSKFIYIIIILFIIIHLKLWKIIKIRIKLY